jgi:ATP-dependent DNA ligase
MNTLPFGPPLAPMLGTLADGLPSGPGWLFEPKWDGFRVLVWREGEDLELRSRDSRPLLRYFPELRKPLLAALPEVAVADGELVLWHEGSLDFDRLQLRLHPAASRIHKLAVEMPTALILWDLLAVGGDDLRERPFRERRAALLERVTEQPSVRITPATTDRDQALDWFRRFEGAGLDGVMAKPLEEPYQPGKRPLVKVKHVRTIDAVVAGFRWHKDCKGTEVGSLVLGLFDEQGILHPIGVASAFKKTERRRLVEVLTPLREDLDAHPWVHWATAAQRPDHSRWNPSKDLGWENVRLELVVEVTTTQHSGLRLRHRAHVLRWRTDKSPRECTTDQMEVLPAAELVALFAR